MSGQPQELANNSFLLFRKLSSLLGFKILFELLDSFTLNMKTFRIVCVIPNQIREDSAILVSIAVNGVIPRNNFKWRELSEAVVYHVVTDCIKVVAIVL